MPNRPYTDMHELAKGEAMLHNRPFVEAVMFEFERTHKKMDNLEALVRKQRELNYHDIIHYTWKLGLTIGMILLTGC